MNLDLSISKKYKCTQNLFLLDIKLVGFVPLPILPSFGPIHSQPKKKILFLTWQPNPLKTLSLSAPKLRQLQRCLQPSTLHFSTDKELIFRVASSIKPLFTFISCTKVVLLWDFELNATLIAFCRCLFVRPSILDRLCGLLVSVIIGSCLCRFFKWVFGFSINLYFLHPSYRVLLGMNLLFGSLNLNV